MDSQNTATSTESLEMISMLLMASDPPNSPNNMLERTKQVQQASGEVAEGVRRGPMVVPSKVP